ncbi:uncharacterized protein METZ01_LOCUS137513, partial [marine metagenome]
MHGGLPAATNRSGCGPTSTAPVKL